jgi:hypothetical protein
MTRSEVSTRDPHFLFTVDAHEVRSPGLLPCSQRFSVLARNAVLRTIFCLLLVLPTGCAELPAPPGNAQREAWGTLVVVPARYPPGSNFRAFAVGKGAGAAKGGLAGSATGLAGAGIFAAGGALEAVIAPYLAVVVVPVGAAVGAYGGSRAAMSEQDAAELETGIEQNLTTLQVPATLARAIVDTAAQDTGRALPLLAAVGPTMREPLADYRDMAQPGVDSVLEVDVTEAGFTGGRQLSFYLVAKIRVVHTGDGIQLYKREFVYQSDNYDARLWYEHQAALFQAELQRAYASLAGSVIEQVFLLTDAPLVSRVALRGEASLTEVLAGRDACGLAWVSPERDFHTTVFGDTDHRDWNRFPTLDSRQPTLAWEAFPRESDRRAAGRGSLSGISNVRYDLRVWQVASDAPPARVYERRDLPAPSHTLDLPLLPGTRYFWSARARFDLGKRVQGTKWGYFRTPAYQARGKVKPDASPAVLVGAATGSAAAPRDVCTLDFIPTANYYRFQTPQAGPQG